MSGALASVPTAWAPSTWQPGQPATPSSADTSQWPMPSATDIATQRAAIQARLAQYGYPPEQLSDQQVVNTMTNLPQAPIYQPPWLQDYYRRNPSGTEGVAARPGIDRPTDQTYEDWNLRLRGLGGNPVKVGYGGYSVPRAALVERYGENAVTAAEQANGHFGLDVPDSPLLADIRVGQADPAAVKAANLQPANWQDLFDQKARWQADLIRRQSQVRPDFFSYNSQGQAVPAPTPAGFHWQPPGSNQLQQPYWFHQQPQASQGFQMPDWLRWLLGRFR